MAGRDAQGGPGPLRRALGYLRSYKRESIGAALALMLVSGANLVAPLLVGRAIDTGIAPRQADVLVYVVAGLVV
ncbi:MAG: ABC transporter ATP-binding protein, partial [Rubrobacter sp.]|nr:ABC transporter ATP-binding protein [Rubrobacter sp.]